MSILLTLLRRELQSYFATPLAYMFIAVFLGLSGLFTFSLGGFYEQGQANLNAFFMWHPWLYLVLVPALSMRLWAEERNSGTIELLLTLPVTIGQAVIAKFIAAWMMIIIALALTFPIVLTVAYLGEPDFGVIAAGYIGSALMAGAYLAIGACLSAVTRSQVISFVLTEVVCFSFLLASFPVVLDWFVAWSPQWLVEAISEVSFSTHFESIKRGVLELNDIVFFVVLIAGWLYACAVLLEFKKAD
jgi:ABC-2 type transport system permease protein